MGQASFSDIAIVSCGTLSLELRYLQKSGFLDARHIFYNTPGLHERPRELERQLIYRINKAKEKADRVPVVYGGKFCYIVKEPLEGVTNGSGSNKHDFRAFCCWQSQDYTRKGIRDKECTFSKGGNRSKVRG